MPISISSIRKTKKIANPPENFRRVRLGSIRNKNSNASKRLIVWEIFSFRMPGFPFPLFCSQEQNSRNILRNIFLFRNIPNKRALGRHVVLEISFSSPLLTSARYKKHCGMFGPKMCFFFQTAIFNPNSKPAQYSKCHIRLHLLFSVLQLFVSRSKQL